MKFFARAVIAVLVVLATGGLRAQRTIHIPADQPSIQAGIDAAGAGDTVLIAPGTYYENIDFKGKAITVTSSAGPATTILDGSRGQTAAAAFHTNETRAAVLNGLTIQGGGNEGSQAYLTEQSLPGIYIHAGQPTISNNVVTHNHCYGIFSSGSSPLIENNEIDHTLDQNGSCTFAGGSAIWLSGSSLYSYGADGMVIGVPATVRGNTIQDNTASGKEDAGGNGGVGVAVWAANALIEGNIIRNNTTLGEGAIYAFNTDAVKVIGNLIYGNTAGYISAGIDLRPPEATVGAFIGIVESNTVYANIVPKTQYNGNSPTAQIQLEGNLGQYILVNNVVFSNGSGTTAVSCGTGYNYLSITPLVFDHNDIYNPGGPAYGGACPDQTGSYGNISADPLFANAAAGDFHLRAGSPAIDTGNNSAPMLLATDIAGANRIQDATGLGYPVVDMGAYEMPGQTAVTPDFLTLTPSTYYPYAYGDTAPFTLTAKLTSTAGTGMGPVTFYEDLKPIGTLALDSTGSAVLQPTGIVPGVHAFVATYPGQGGYPPAVSAKFYVLFPLATPILNVTSAPNPSIFGTPVTFTVDVSSSDGTIPSPVVLYDNSTINGPNVNVLATLTPDANGHATFTTSTLSLGDHRIVASFAATATSNAATQTLLQRVISGYETATTIASSLNPSTFLQPVTFAAHVTASSAANGAPTGVIAFLDGAATLATVPLDATGSASFTTSSLSANATPHRITAQYIPSGGFASSSASLNQTVNGLGIATATGVAVYPNPSTYGQPVFFTARVSYTTSYALAPTGTVLFTFCRGATYRANLDALGIARFIAPVPNAIPDPAGTCTVTATYSGDVQFLPSTSATAPYIINPAPSTVQVAAQPNPAYQGQAVTLTAQVFGIPSPTADPVTGLPIPPGPLTATGDVSFYDGATPIGTVALTNGQAVLSTSTLSVGTHTLSAIYRGSFNLLGSTSASVPEVVLPSTFTIGLSPASVVIPSRTRTQTIITLSGIGVYSGTLQLTAGPLPQYASVAIAPASVTLPAGGSVSASLALDTVSLPPGVVGANRGARPVLPYALAGLLTLPWMLWRRRALPQLLAAWLVAALLFSSAGCANISYGLNTVAPGTYIIPVTATDSATGMAKTANFTLTVTPP